MTGLAMTGLNPDFVKRVQRKRREAVHHRVVTSKADHRFMQMFNALRARNTGLGLEEHSDINLPLEKLIAVLAQQQGYSYEAIVGPSRRRDLSAARDRVIAALKRLRPGLSYPELGDAFNRNHASIFWALRRAGATTPTGQKAKSKTAKRNQEISA